MLLRTRRPLFLCLLAPLLALAACGESTPPVLPGDGGQQSDGGGGMQQSMRVLRPNLGLDLANVVSFAVLSSGGGASGGIAAPTVPKALDASVDDGGPADGSMPGDPGGLFALTLQGETLAVALVEEGNPSYQGSLQQPIVMEIYPTASWVLFHTPGFTVHRMGGDGGLDEIPCNSIAARRSDGALFCGGFAGRPTTHGLDFSLQTNATGDIVYLVGGDPASGSERVFRLSLGAEGGPTAVGLTPIPALPWWFFSNADGDLLHSYSPSPLDPSVRQLVIFPIDGSAPISLGDRPAGQATRGAVGAPDENTFYALVGGGGGIGFMGSVRVFTKQNGGFVETEVVPNLGNVTSYGMLLRLGDGIHLFSPTEKAIARIFDAGTLVETPTPVPIVGVDSFLNVQGVAATPLAGSVVFLANTPSGVQFIRHDGTTQQNIPVPSDITLTRVIYAQSGAIDFIGLRSSTLETVRGSVEPGSTTVVVATTGVLDPARIVTFTRIR